VDAVYDGQTGNYSEDDEPNPVSVYGKTKLNGEWSTIEADPDALITRVNLFGWSLKGKRSLAEWFFYNLQAGKHVKGFTDVHFCPILANDLSMILLRMMKQKLSGLYNVVGAECVSKYNFGKELAETFQLDPSLLLPISVNDFGLKAFRGNNLSLKTDKLSTDLGQVLPGFSTGLKQFAALYQQGYPQELRKMVDNSNRDINPYKNGG
jgi:dTDP-4-dehydrorhamnose reductase